jgi:nitric oxide reductase large subunit
MSSPFVAGYWPLLVGALLMLVFMMRGYTRATIPMAAITLLIQAWHSGVFGAK